MSSKVAKPSSEVRFNFAWSICLPKSEAYSLIMVIVSALSSLVILISLWAFCPTRKILAKNKTFVKDYFTTLVNLFLIAQGR